jgi:hypothetical protein
MPEKIAFYDLEKTKDERGYIGALLVTDELGKPEEFRVTYPVKPSVVQQHLYGASLESHIGVVLCGAPLYHELRNRDDIALIVLASESYLHLADHVGCYVVTLTRAGEKMSVGDEAARSFNLGSTNPGFQPIEVTCPNSYTDEMILTAQGFIERFFRNIDLIEPFERISKAVAALGDADAKFQ